MAATSCFVQTLGAAVKKVAGKRGSTWYTPHMAAASRAIAERLPLVDLVVEVRDARVPLSSEYELLRNFAQSPRHIIVLNKMDLANRMQTEEWRAFFERQNYVSYGVNSHNKEDIRRFLNFIQAEVRELKRSGHANHTTTVMLVGIPNVGKSALANSLHQIGRISAAEKGKLKHATVSPQPGETRNISSLKIASHPNIYVLDTPGVLPPEIPDDEVCSKLALTGALGDYLVGEAELAQYFLAILNLSDEYKKWAKLCTSENEKLSVDEKLETSGDSKSDKRWKEYTTDHTQDGGVGVELSSRKLQNVINGAPDEIENKDISILLTSNSILNDCRSRFNFLRIISAILWISIHKDFIVRDVRRALFEAISAFDGNIEDGKDLVRLIEAQFVVLSKALHVPAESEEGALSKVAAKLLNLFRTGRLGHYTLDPVPRNS